MTRRAPPGYAPDLPPGCEVRTFRDGDEEALLELLSAAFKRSWPRRKISVPPLEHLRWKLRSHELALNLHFLAEQDGRIIGCRPAWVSPLAIDGRVVLSRLAIDRAVLPELQRQRVMTAMEARTPPDWFDRFDVAVGLSNNWQSVNFVPGTPYRRKIDIVSRPLDGEIAVSTPSDTMLRRISAFDDRVDALWHEAQPIFRAIFVRTKDRLNYRFADPRAGDYAIVLAEQGARVLGYVIYSSWQQTGRIADVLVLPGRLDILDALLSYAMSDLRSAGNSTVECWRFVYHPYRQALERLGIDKPTRKQRVSLHALPGRGVDVAFFADPKSAVHMMAGDTDLV